MNKARLYAIIYLFILTPVGFYTKFYDGYAAAWVNNALGGVLYVIFWCLIVFLFFPKGNPLLIATVVFGATCFLEILQLWHPPFLNYLRSFFIARTVLGTSFAWSDFPHYFAGALLGYLSLIFLRRAE